MDGVLFGLTSDSPRGRLLGPDCPDPGATAPGELLSLEELLYTLLCPTFFQ